MIEIINSNVLEFNTDQKYHAIISDPPYGLAFMGKGWDSFKTPLQYQQWVTEWSSHLMQFLYPGAICAFFGGTRTYHRLATGLEDAGYEIFDSMIWCYGSGFPKSYNISKGIDKIKDRNLLNKLSSEIKRARIESGLSLTEIGNLTLSKTNGKYGNWYHRGGHMFFETGLKIPSRPEWELFKEILPIGKEFYNIYEQAERELIETKTDNGNRQIPLLVGNKEYEITSSKTEMGIQWQGYGTALKPAYEPIVLCRKPLEKGGYVNSVLKYDTSGLNIDGGRIGNETLINKPSQNHNTTNLHQYGLSPNAESNIVNGRFPANFGLICDCEKEPCECSNSNIGDSARFFYTAKASSKERELGLEVSDTRANNHPTVKPIKLIEYLATLLLPPIDNSSILIPFSGVGSEIIGANLAGWNHITGIEIDENYVNIANKRLEYWEQYDSYDDAMKSKKLPIDIQLELL